MTRSKHARRKAHASSSQRRSHASKPAASTPWPTIEAFLANEEGTVSLGAIGYHEGLGYTAVANDEHNMLVALVQRRGETLHQLLDRLEQALGPAIEEQIYIDEINSP